MNQTKPEKTVYCRMGWNFLICAELILGFVLAVGHLLGLGMPVMAGMGLIAAFSAACMAAAKLYRTGSVVRRSFILPLLLLAALFLLGNYLRGALAFLNQLISRWNLLHADGLRLFTDNATWNDPLAFYLAFGIVTGMVTWRLASHGFKISCGLFVLFWTGLMLLLDDFQVWAAVFLFGAFFEKVVSLRGQVVTWRNQGWCALTFALLAAGGILFNGERMTTVDALREDAKQEVRKLRYGEQVLPEGDLYKADMLQAADNDRLTVTTEQQKTVYLKGFVGGTYEEQSGSWETLTNDAYSGDYRGMLKWLKKQGFDPLAQTAAYYALGDTGEQPQRNTLQIQVDTASREYGYVPASLDTVQKGRLSEKKDQGMVSAGLFGQRTYTVEEVSGTRPAELMVLQDWISAPETEAQKVYCDAEAVYRNFVYDTYTETDFSMEGLLDELFWQDYEAENDGIYSALSHVRDVLKKNVQYTKTPEVVPEGDTPLYWGLFEAHEGNAMLFATAAVQALRLYGIPARYVEGYYLPESLTRESTDGTVTLTGENTHAWVEIYFDGMGWQPVDVTPGYYYDTMTLRQMVSLPDTVHKTAAIEDEGGDASESSASDTMDAMPLQDSIYYGPSAVLIALGVLAILVVLFTACTVVLELLRLGCRKWEAWQYSMCTPKQQVYLLNRCIHKSLALHGLESGLGWKNVSVDVQAAEMIDGVEAGECARVNHLFEKQMYGQIVLESFEVRTIVSFLRKVTRDHSSYSWKKRLRLHYISLHFQPEFDKIAKMSKVRRKCQPGNGQ